MTLGAHGSVVQAHLPLLVSDLCSGGSCSLSLLTAVCILVKLCNNSGVKRC